MYLPPKNEIHVYLPPINWNSRVPSSNKSKFTWSFLQIQTMRSVYFWRLLAIWPCNALSAVMITLYSCCDWLDIVSQSDDSKHIYTHWPSFTNRAYERKGKIQNTKTWKTENCLYRIDNSITSMSKTRWTASLKLPALPSPLLSSPILFSPLLSRSQQGLDYHFFTCCRH